MCRETLRETKHGHVRKDEITKRLVRGETIISSMEECLIHKETERLLEAQNCTHTHKKPKNSE